MEQLTNNKKSIKTMMNCSYPECSNLITVTVDQKRELKTHYFLKYGKTVDVYCCKECQDKHLRELTEAKFMDKGSLKNHEYAIIFHGADVTKRTKEKEVFVVAGTKTEMRARCLSEKLISMLPRQKRKYMTSKEVQMFLINGLPDNIKVPYSNKKDAAKNVMNKTKELYPTMFFIGWVNQKSKYIEYIK